MVCPGTSSWNALCGRTANCIQNIRGAVEAGVAHGAVGMLLTDWGDAGHTQPRALSYVGIVTGGGLAWNPSPAPVIDPEAHVVSAGDWIGEWGEKDVAKLLDTFVFWDVDTSVGTVLTELGNTYLHTGGGAAANNNGTALFRILMCSCRDSRSVPEGVTSAGLRSAAKHARDLTDALDAAGKSVRLKEDLEGIRIAVDMTVLACRMGQALLRHHCSMTALPLTQRTDFANRLIPLTGRLAAHWRQQNREGGFAETKKLLSESISVLLGPDGIAAVETTTD
jgi:hexosaminidase